LEKEELDKIVKEVIELVKDVPDEYRQTTYKVLLALRLQGSEPASGDIGTKEETSWIASIHVGVKSFLKRNKISEKVLEDMFLPDGESFEPTYLITTTKKARAQIQVACLTALEHALHDGVFEFSIEDVRQRVIDLDRHDSKNFTATFRQYERLFRSLTDAEHVELASEGLAELAKVIEEVTS